MKHQGKNIVIVLALVAAGFFLAYLRFRPYLGTEGVFTDGQALYESATGEEIRYAVWDEPVALPPGVNTEGWESRPAVTPDGLYLIFCSGRIGFNTDLYIADLVDGEPVHPRPLAGINTAADECAPAFSGGALYFASNRGNSVGGLDIYRADYDQGLFGIPRNLGQGINTEGDETDPAPIPASTGLLFASDRGGRGDFDLFVAHLAGFQNPDAEDAEWEVEALASLNTLFEEREPAFSADGLTLVFASDRDGSAGGYDLYRSVTDQGAWAAPQPLTGLNTEFSERGPWASPDGFTLLYTFLGPEGGADMLRVRSRELFRLPGRPIGWLDLSILAGLFLLALLAYLAKRWVSLDILYKCAIISLLVHLLMMLWFRDVKPEGSVVEIPEHEADYKVHIAVDPTRALAEAEERGGQLEVDRAEKALAAEAPERSDSVEIETAAESAPAAELARAEAPSATAPGREAAELERAEAAKLAQVRTEQPVTEFERIQGAAPSMDVEAQPLAAAEHAVETGEVGRAEPAPVEVAETAPAERSLEPVARRMEAAPQAAPVAAEVQPSRPAPSTLAPVPVSEPVEEFARMSGQAPALASEQAPARAVPGERITVAEPGRSAAQAAQPAAPRPQATRETWTGSGLALAVQSVKREDSRIKRLVPEALRQPEVTVSDEAQVDPSVFEGRDAEAPGLSMPQAPALAARAGDAEVTPLQRTETAAEETLAASPGAEPVRDGLSLAPSPMPALAPQRSSTPAQPLQRHQPLASASVAVNQPVEHYQPMATPAAELADSEEYSPTAVAAPVRPHAQAPEGPARQAFAPSGAAEPAAEGPAASPVASLQRPETSPEPAARVSEAFAPAREAPDAPEVALRVPEGEGKREVEPPAPQTGTGGTELSPVAMGGHRRAAAPQTGPARRSFGSHQDGSESLRPSATPLVAEAPQEPAEKPDPMASAGPEPTQWEHTPYKTRFGGEKAIALREHGGTAETEAAVDRGLAYLASRQKGQGHWGTHNYYHGKYGYTAIGKTGLAMLAFMGAGHTQDSRTQYSRNVERAIRFLVGVQETDSGHFSYTASYSHGIATYALAECYALTKDRRLRRPLQRAVAHILDKQNKIRDRRLFGGWGYYYSDDRTYDQWPRASITAWQVMALESARLGGIEVPDEVFANAKIFLQNSQDVERGFFRYSQDPERLRSNYPTLPGATPASLFALSILGEDPAGDRFAKSRAFILKRAPKQYRYTSGDDFVYQAVGNLYFWYYSSLAMFRSGGDAWETWNAGLKSTLLPAQQPDGSWMPISLYADYAGDTEEDRTYTTAMCVLCLEVYYRYFTPLLQVD